MKKSISIIETILSIILISIVIGILLKTKQTSMNIVGKANQTIQNKNFIYSTALNTDILSSNINHDLYLSSIFFIQNDDLRKKMKNIQIEIKQAKNSIDKLTIFNQTYYVNFYKFDFHLKNNIENQNFYNIDFQQINQ